MVAGPILMAYFTAWSIYARNYFVADIPADKITHINYAFANVGSDLTIVLGDSWADVEKTFPNDTWDQPLRGNFNQLIKLKAKYPHVQTLISVGGWVNLLLLVEFFYHILLSYSSRHGPANFLTLPSLMIAVRNSLHRVLLLYKSIVLMELILIGNCLFLFFI